MSSYTSNPVKARQASRILAVQCLYAATIYHDYANIQSLIKSVAESQSASDVFAEQYNNYDKKYLVRLITGTIAELEHLNTVIAPHLAEDWSVQRLGQVVKCILWLSTWELLHPEGLSASIIIDEYINIAKIFNHEGETGFINSVLDQVAKTHPINL